MSAFGRSAFDKIMAAQLGLDSVRHMPPQDDANARRVHILFAEIDTAAAMIVLVKYAREPQVIRRYKEVALQSYRSVLEQFTKTTMDPKQEADLWDRLAPIRQYLEAEGLLKYSWVARDLASGRTGRAKAVLWRMRIGAPNLPSESSHV
jgi:hypothetical protein